MKESWNKKKLSKITTFPVPLSLVDKEKKFNITTNTQTTTNKPSKEQLINQALNFHSKGNIIEASKYYTYFINQGFKDPRVFSNYGAILKTLGKLEEAEFYTRRAIKLNPDFAEAHSNLGSTLKDLGKLEEAELSTRKAITINPDFADAHLNLGAILQEIGKLEEAELSTRKAIKLNPSSIAKAYINLGNILSKLDDLHEALDCYIKTIELDKNYPNIYPLITRFLRNSNPSLFNQTQLKYILNILLEKNDIIHTELFTAFRFLYARQLESNEEKLVSDFNKIRFLANKKIIINALKKIPFRDSQMEKDLVKIRKYICNQIAENKVTINRSDLKFTIALGEQCFLNEYIYSFTKQEKKSIQKIINRCINGQINEINIAIISCYFPLYKLIDQIPFLDSFNSSDKNFKELIKLQILEPLNEIKLSKNIKRLGSINNNISQKVKSQYEENPYPRWRYGNYFKSHKISFIKAINNEIKPNIISQNTDKKLLKVLIAGCGTGKQILKSQKYKNAEVTAIDLSLSSLSYAQRKINELGINNTKLIQMDILEIGLLEEKFDVIECGGVLHHMDNPSKGLKVLLDILKNNGFLKLGLYSELARRNIIKAREYIHANNLQPNNEDIKSFRDDVFSGKIQQLSNLRHRSDFYTMSACRDLCFHAKEHLFSIKQLQDNIKSNELKFLGFILPQNIKSLYKKYFPIDKKQTQLKNWAIFEEKYPNTFIGMYQFWVYKK